VSQSVAEDVVKEPRVVQLAHDIARNQSHLAPDEAAVAVATHLRAFWDPRMRDQLKLIVQADPDLVDPVVRQAAALLP
jgi:formate dehydrogenase subunit delta